MKPLIISLLFALLNITNPLFGVDRVSFDIEANKVTILSLQNQEIGDTDIKAIARALEKNTSLTTLYLSGNQIGDVGAQALALALEKNTSLTQLDLGLNQIGDKGAKALATALEKNTSLTQLDLRVNQIGDNGAKALATALEKNTSLTQLNLSMNFKIKQEEFALAFLEAFKSNKSLEDLFFCYDSLDPKLWEAIRVSLASNKATSYTKATSYNKNNKKMDRHNFSRQHPSKQKTATDNDKPWSGGDEYISPEDQLNIATTFRKQFTSSNEALEQELTTLKGAALLNKLAKTQYSASFNRKDSKETALFFFAKSDRHFCFNALRMKRLLKYSDYYNVYIHIFETHLDINDKIEELKRSNYNIKYLEFDTHGAKPTSNKYKYGKITGCKGNVIIQPEENIYPKLDELEAEVVLLACHSDIAALKLATKFPKLKSVKGHQGIAYGTDLFHRSDRVRGHVDACYLKDELNEKKAILDTKLTQLCKILGVENATEFINAHDQKKTDAGQQLTAEIAAEDQVFYAQIKLILKELDKLTSKLTSKS